MIAEGKYAAKAVEFAYGTAGTGIKQVGVNFAVSRGENEGEQLPWFGFFNSPENKQRTFKVLRTCGADLNDMVKLPGLTTNEVQIVVTHEEYKGVVSAKIAFVNPLGGIPMKDRMDAEELKAFAASMRGDALAFMQDKDSGKKPSTEPKKLPEHGYGPPLEEEIPF